LKEDKLKNIILTTSAILILAATSAFANEITFNQRDIVGVSNLDFEQANIGDSNEINLGVSDGMISVVIKQGGEGDEKNSSGNTAKVELYVNYDITQFNSSNGANKRDGWKTFSSTFDGDGNNVIFKLGSSSDTTQFSSVGVDIAVTGDSNDLNHYVTNGSDGDSLQISGIVSGDSNYVLATLGAAGDIAFNYDIEGNNNKYTSTIAGPASGGRTVDLVLTGDSNVWTVTANSEGGVLNVASYGSYVTGTHTQTGMGSDLQMDITSSSFAALAVTTTQTGPAFADVVLNAAGGGAFTLTQTGAASYKGAISLSPGGAATITQ
jgi:hypothetical protein